MPYERSRSDRPMGLSLTLREGETALISTEVEDAEGNVTTEVIEVECVMSPRRKRCVVRITAPIEYNIDRAKNLTSR